MSHNPHQDDDIVAELLPAFIEEAHEQIAELEHLLLQLEDQPDNSELLNALFRCAHTIKGSAGVFGLNRIVSFTHHVETLLDQLREGLMHLTPALSNLLLQSNDAIHVLVKTAHETDEGEPEVVLARQVLVEQLQAATRAVSAPASTTMAATVSPLASQTRLAPGATDATGRWHLSVQFGPDTFRHGMDPLTLLNYVGKLGQVHQVACDVDAVPALDAFDPESCHLAFELSLDTDADREKIEGAFTFVREDCELRLIEPGATAADFVAMIGDMPNHPRLGDILVLVGAVSRAQLDEGLKLQSQTKAEAGLAPPIGEVLQGSAGLSPQVVDAALNKQQRQREALGAAGGPDDKGFIRVHANRLDEVINLLGELVIAGAGASLQARQTRQRGLIEANQRITRLIEGIRNSTLKLRMVPIGDTFARFRRVVRDTAAELGKDVELELVGGETELDKAMVERITDPLMHLVRNALDHGLETPADRLAIGKPEQGRLTLSACHESGSILIKITDNGRGIQRQKVLQRAWDRGLVEPGHVPLEEDIFKLIFEPGFSTAEAVTNLSGRGVGMDVVRRNIEAMRGSVALSSQEGKGSTVEIRLPLTLAIIDGFLVGTGGSKFIFPLEAVVEVIEGRASTATLDEQGRCWVELRGQVLPVVNLRTLYSLESPEPERCSIVVVRAGNRRFGVMVDSLLGQHQTVIKPLGLMLRSLRGVSGSSILGTGEVALIFDVVSLGQLASSSGRGRAPTSKASVSFAPSVDTPVL